MHQISRLSLPAFLLLLLSATDLYLIGVAMLHRHSRSATPSGPLRDEARTLGLILLSSSQLLYLMFFFAWLFQWMHFYPGNPTEEIAILCGLSFSVAGLCTAPFGPSSQRLITIVVALTTVGMWLLAAVASVAV
jgi:hypothetical protein